MGQAEVIALSEVRASSQWQRLRDDLHGRFDQWLDGLQAQLPDPQALLAEVSETVWRLRQDLSGSICEAIVEHGHAGESGRPFAPCPDCGRRLRARPIGGAYGRNPGRRSARGAALFLLYGSMRWVLSHGQRLGIALGPPSARCAAVMVDLTTEAPYEMAAGMFGRLTGIDVSSERMHALTHQAAEGLTLLEVAPSREQIDPLVAQAAKGRFRRPVLVLGGDGAYVPSRPDSARGRRPGQARQRARRARWQHEWREAKGFRLYLLDGDRIVHVLSWHQVQNEHDLVLLCQFTRLSLYLMFTPCIVLYEAKDFCRIHTRFILSSMCQNPNLTK